MEKLTYKNLTLKQRSRFNNGCGGKGSWFKPPYRIFFEASCQIHDINYWLGDTEEDRTKADKGFLKYMKSDINQLYSKYNPKRYYFLAWAQLYYIGVRLFGDKYFNYDIVTTRERLDKL